MAVSDLAVSNHTDPRTVTLTAEVTSNGPAYDGPVLVSILRDGKEVWTGAAPLQVPAGGTDSALVEARVPDAELWDIGHPALYTARARLEPGDHTARDTIFGFRWFTVEGVGKDARFHLNHQRVVLRSADSWGFWAPNGMFPDRAAAERETAAVQALGLNAIQNSRHLPKAAVFDAFDRAGLLRWCEPGGGIFAVRNTPEGGVPRGNGPVDTSGDGGAPVTWFNRYETAKALGMVRAYRSHPSVPGWTLLSGVDPGDLHNPKVFATLRRMHDLDPSRPVVLKSSPSASSQAWLAPYGTEFHFDNGKDGSGWHDEQTADACPGIVAIPQRSVAGYQDGMYRAPDGFSYRSENEKEVAAWGEAAAGASADDHTEIDKWYDKNNLTGYDRAAHDVLADAYEKALDRYDFRKAFPTAESLFRLIAAKQYFAAARLLENARLSNPNDLFTLAGWESTTVDAHSGLVDALRHPKGDPSVIKAANAPALLVVRPRHYVVAKGEAAVVDIHLINETNLRGEYALLVSAFEEGGGKPFYEEKFPVKATGGERFGELLKDGIGFTSPKPGYVKLTASLLPKDGEQSAPALTRTDFLLVVDTNPEPIKKTVAVVAGSAPIAGALEQQLGLKAVPLEEVKGKVDDILVDTNLWQYERTDRITKADDPNLYKEQLSHGPGDIVTVRDLAPGPLKVELFFAETRWERPGQRVFDVGTRRQHGAGEVRHRAGGGRQARGGCGQDFQRGQPRRHAEGVRAARGHRPGAVCRATCDRFQEKDSGGGVPRPRLRRAQRQVDRGGPRRIRLEARVAESAGTGARGQPSGRIVIGRVRRHAERCRACRGEAANLQRHGGAIRPVVAGLLVLRQETLAARWSAKQLRARLGLSDHVGRWDAPQRARSGGSSRLRSGSCRAG